MTAGDSELPRLAPSAAVGKTLRILGIRGLPASHGGFETFAQNLALYLRDRGWRVIVYCQAEPETSRHTDLWEGIERVHIPAADSSVGTMWFDWLAICDAGRHRDQCLTLGYNTALFCAWLRARRIRNVINMDGIEWRRAKWGRLAKLWFWINERAGCWLGDALIADHPEIANHLATKVARHKITMIPYGGTVVTGAPDLALQRYALRPQTYLTLIARPEPENNILEVVRAFSAKRRGLTLVVLGRYDKNHDYQARVLAAASDEVKFVGAVYDSEVLESLRFHCLAYLHGHSVGGTNPSLVEALAASNAVIAHDNHYNRWVAGDGAVYFKSEAELMSLFDSLLGQPSKLAPMRVASFGRVQEELNWPMVLAAYERLLLV